jgi:hypothetical protein
LTTPQWLMKPIAKLAANYMASFLIQATDTANDGRERTHDDSEHETTTFRTYPQGRNPC